MYSSLKKQISLNSGIVLFVIGFAASFLLFRYHAEDNSSVKNRVQVTSTANGADCEVKAFRRSGYDFTKPLLYTDQSCESPELLPVKKSLNELINSFKASNDLTNASIYLRDFERGKWTGIQETDAYRPGSLSKVPLMISYLYKAKFDPSLLDKEYVYEAPPPGTLPTQNYKTVTVEPGKKYSVRELLRYMIVHSDNNATWMLSEKMGVKDYEKTFLDLGLIMPQPDPKDNTVYINAREYSVFFRALYNSSYLAPEDSEYALSLLGESSFSEGFRKGLPPGVKVVHKFAEWDNGTEFELHESGIFYLKGKGYLVTIMTRGKDRSKLPNVIAELTRTIYSNMLEP